VRFSYDWTAFLVVCDDNFNVVFGPILLLLDFKLAVLSWDEFVLALKCEGSFGLEPAFVYRMCYKRSRQRCGMVTLTSLGCGIRSDEGKALVWMVMVTTLV
jgi:hypothetical protein